MSKRKRRKNINNRRSSGNKWSKSVAEYLTDQGLIKRNEDLDVKHPKIANPDLFKK